MFIPCACIRKIIPYFLNTLNVTYVIQYEKIVCFNKKKAIKQLGRKKILAIKRNLISIVIIKSIDFRELYGDLDNSTFNGI